ncbi:MAG: globin domain-containing protein [Pirellulaceae bacterium]
MSKGLTITDSVNAILTSKDSFGAKFYECMFRGFPDLKMHFDSVDMHKQSVMVTTALTLIEKYYTHPNDAIRMYLQVLGTRHCDRQIPQDRYADWLDALLETLREFHGEDWNEDLAAQWADAINNANIAIFEGYTEHFHV